MAELSTLARPYAKAAFEYARERGSLEQWAQQLSETAAVVSDERVAAVLDDPALTAEQQVRTLVDLCGDSMGAELRNFLAVLAANKRIALLPEILAQFNRFKAGLEQSVEVEVVSAFELPQETSDRLAAALGKKLEREVRVSTRTDEHLLGGVLIRAGDMVIDGTVRGRLNKLAEAVTS